MSTMKLPANYASISEEEMVYLDGGASDAYNSFLNIGKVFNAIARIFSGASSIINNVNVPDSGRSAEELLIRLLFSSVFQELSPLWEQFFLFLTHFQSGVIVYIKRNNFFILWQKNAQKKHFCYASVAHVVLTYRVEVYPSNWRCHVEN